MLALLDETRTSTHVEIVDETVLDQEDYAVGDGRGSSWYVGEDGTGG